MVDWTTNKPNARFWVLKLIKDNFGPGDKLVSTQGPGADDSGMEAQAFLTAHGKRLLLVNKRNRALEVQLPGEAAAATAEAVDETSGEGPARTVKIEAGKLSIEPFAVTVVSW
jgi:hypothetical protein